MAKKSYTLSTIRYFLLQARHYWPVLLVIFSMVAVTQIVDAYITTLYRDFVNTLTTAIPENTVRTDGDFFTFLESETSQQLLGILITILLVNMIMWLSWRIVGFCDAVYGAKVKSRITDNAYNYMQKHSYRFFTDSFAGSLVKRITRLGDAYLDVSDNVIYMMFPTVITIFTSLYFTYQIDPLISGILLIWILFYLVLVYFLAKSRMHLENISNEADSRISGYLSDIITNFLNVITFGSYDREHNGLKRVLEEWRLAKTKSWLYATLHDAVQSFLMLLIEFILFFVALGLWQQGTITVGDFVMLQGLLLILFHRIWEFGRNIRKFADAVSKGAEMVEILEQKHEVNDTPAAKPIRITKGHIRFENLTFAYPNSRNVFENFSLEIPAHRKIAFVSRSGSGKSTLIRLLMRLYNISTDTIFIDDQDIMNVSQVSLRKQISFVAQDPVLFHRTLADNIAYGKPDATMEEIVNASKVAHCHEFITALPDGYKTFVGERGIKLSGGERQRVAIARAVLEDNPIVILDEATSSLDSESEKYIQEGLHHLFKDKTAIVIAHRLSTIVQMDEIIVIEEGKIKERGTHSELLQKDEGRYKQLWDIQSGGYDAEE